MALTSLGRVSCVLFSGALAFGAADRVAYADEPAASEPSAAEPAPSATPDSAAAPTTESASSPAAAPETAATPAPENPIVTPAPKPAPYSLPFALRPAAAATVLRADTAFAFYEDPTTKKSGSTIAPVFTFSYKVVDHFAPLVRLGVVSNSPPAPGESGFGFLNPVLGGTYVLEPATGLRIGLFLGVTVPIGSGGGDHPDAGQKLARTAGIPARSAMDNAMFAVDDFTVFPGVDVAFVSHGFTVQGEATLFQLTRVRGAADQLDSSRTNFTTGLHAGYFFVPWLSAAVELRHQRWLSTPKAVAADKTGASRDTTTIAFGPRFHFQYAEGKWFRPAVALALPLDDPMKKSSYKILQLDLPFSF